MKLKLLLSLTFVAFFSWIANSQNTQLFSENFESGGATFLTNAIGVGGNIGSNQWIINKQYTGGGSVPNTMNEDSTFGGTISYAPFSYYLHIYDQPSGYTNCAYNPVNQSDRFAYLSNFGNGVCTLDAYGVSVNFFYLGVGSANAYATVYYSRDNGPWYPCGAAQYNAKYKWQYTTITNSNFDNAHSLRIGFRWQNNAGSGTDTSSFGIDDISIVGTYDTVAHPVKISCHVSPDTICVGGGSSVNLYWVTSDTLCDGTYSILMSDSTGNFNTPPLSWSAGMYWPQDTSFTYNLSIPAGIPPGHCYKFRVDRTSPPPVIQGYATGCIYFEKCPDTIYTHQPLVTTEAGHPVCAGSVIQVPFNSTGVYGNTNLYWAELSDSAGNFPTNDTVGTLVSNSAYPGLPGTASGQIPFSVKASCHYFVRVNSDTPHVHGIPWGPFCIQHCDIWSDTASTSIQACIKSCYKDPTGFSATFPYMISKYDTNEEYQPGNKFKVQLLSTMTFGIVATGNPFGVYADTVSGTMTVHVPCADSICNILNVKPGSYYMRVIATNSNQPDSTYGTLLFLNIGNPADSLNLIPYPNTTTFCVGDVPTLYAYPDYWNCANNWNNSTYTWWINYGILNPNIFNQFLIGINLNATGSVNIEVRETNNGCKGPVDTLKLNVKGPPPDNISGPIKVCEGDTGLYSVPFTNNTYYKWKPKGTTRIDTANNVLKVVYDTTGTFTIKIVAIDSCGADSSTRVVKVVAKPVITIPPPAPICKGEAVTLSATATGSPNYFTWKPNIDLSCTKCSTTIASPPSTQLYIVTDSNGACKVTDTVKVVVNPVPTDAACCYAVIDAGESTNLYVNPGTGNQTYSWVPTSSLNCNTCKQVIASPTVTTAYTVTITDSAGCSIVDTVTVEVNQVCGTVWVPDAFSPNGDGQNDVLYVRGGCIIGLDFIIYDRWGNKVFESQDQSVGWNGKYDGQPMNTGTYVYYVSATIQKSGGAYQTITRKGSVTLVR